MDETADFFVDEDAPRARLALAGTFLASGEGSRALADRVSPVRDPTAADLRHDRLLRRFRRPVEAADKGRGYEYAKGSYRMIEDHELDAIEIESNRTIEIDTFVPRAEIRRTFSR